MSDDDDDLTGGGEPPEDDGLTGGWEPPEDDDLTGGEKPPGDELPPTGAHDVLSGDEEEEGGPIPSFEEYRREREEGRHGGWSPFGTGTQPDADGEGEQEPVEGPPADGSGEAPPADQSGEGPPADESGEGPRADESGEGEAADTLPVRGAPEGDEEGGDTLDGGEPLGGTELPHEELPPTHGEEEQAGEPPSVEERLAQQAADVYPTGYEHTPEEIQARRIAAHRRHRRNGRIRLLILLAVIALVVLFIVDQTGGGGKKPSTSAKHPSTPTAVGTGRGHLSVAIDTSVLPGNLLIADWGSRQLLVVSPTGQTVWSYAVNGLYQNQFNPDYAFFDATGDQIVVSEESHAQIERIGVAKRNITYTYGHYNRHGSKGGYLHDPGTAIELSDGSIVVADIRNCRVSVLHPLQHTAVHNFGHVGHCVHGPPRHLDNPVSAFPLANGGLVITELNGDIDLLDSAGKLTASLTVPGLTKPYGTNETASGDLVAVDHTHPGGVEIFTKHGKVIWRYAPKRGKRELFDPSMAIVLPDGDVLVSDDYDDRVIVIDRASGKIVWQYGHLHHRGGRAGYLYLPVGIDLVHPHSLLDSFPNATPPS